MLKSKIDQKVRKTRLFDVKSLVFAIKSGGDKRDRTADLLNAIQSKNPVIPRVFGFLRGNGEEIELPNKIPIERMAS